MRFTGAKSTSEKVGTLGNCDKRTYEQIRDISSKLREQSELKPLDITCINPECKNSYSTKFTLNISDFFE